MAQAVIGMVSPRVMTAKMVASVLVWTEYHGCSGGPAAWTVVGPRPRCPASEETSTRESDLFCCRRKNR